MNSCSATMVMAYGLLLAALLSRSEGMRPQAGQMAPPLRLKRSIIPVLGALRGGGDGHIEMAFSVVCDSTNMGEDVGVIGECEELGVWKNAVRMSAEQVRSLLHAPRAIGRWLSALLVMSSMSPVSCRSACVRQHSKKSGRK